MAKKKSTLNTTNPRFLIQNFYLRPGIDILKECVIKIGRIDAGTIKNICFGEGWENDITKKDLTIDLSRMILTSKDVPISTDTDSLDFSGFNLRNTKFRNLDLRHANFSDAVLNGADFKNCDLSFSHLTRVSANGVKLEAISLGCTRTEGLTFGGKDIKRWRSETKSFFSSALKVLPSDIEMLNKRWLIISELGKKLLKLQYAFSYCHNKKGEWEPDTAKNPTFGTLPKDLHFQIIRDTLDLNDRNKNDIKFLHSTYDWIEGTRNQSTWKERVTATSQSVVRKYVTPFN